ncbi:MAG TPA: zinc ribbon domain-containing protein [Sedimentisphaerales bacterium]|nr:zinc ribbon domain-containing protein [Sedimentisphaerales bacterium]
MPVYEYQCRKCGKRSEFLENVGGDTAKTCGHCGSGDLTKVFSTFSPRIKGGESKRCGGCRDFKCPHAGR